jgi:hypothetical protein
MLLAITAEDADPDVVETVKYQKKLDDRLDTVAVTVLVVVPDAFDDPL